MTIALIIVGACLSLVLIETQTKVLRRAVDDLVYDNKNHYLPKQK
jgi:hypothetical protein